MTESTRAEMRYESPLSMSDNPTTYALSGGLGAVIVAFTVWQKFFRTKADAAESQSKVNILDYYGKQVAELTRQRDAAQAVANESAARIGELSTEVRFQSQQIKSLLTQEASQLKEIHSLRIQVHLLSKTVLEMQAMLKTGIIQSGISPVVDVDVNEVVAAADENVVPPNPK